jgi:hypothetical protein
MFEQPLRRLHFSLGGHFETINLSLAIDANFFKCLKIQGFFEASEAFPLSVGWAYIDLIVFEQAPCQR